MRNLKTFILGLLFSTSLVQADTPPQIINKLCSANQFFSQIQPGPGNINCTQPTYSGIANIPSFINSLVYASNTVQFVNDASSPGITKYYGTNGGGTKGWFDLNGAVTSGNLTDAGTDGISVTGGTSAVLGGGTSLSQHVSDSTHNGYLSSTDWTTFNSKQAAGNYITALTTDVVAAGPGSVAATIQPNVVSNSKLAQMAANTVKANATGSLANASDVSTGTVTELTSTVLTLAGWSNATIGSPTIRVLQSGVGSSGYLSSTDWNTFNNKQPAGSYITALTGDVTATGPGSVASTLATVNGNVGSFGSSTAIPNFTVNGKGLITAAGTNVVIAPAGTLTGTVLAANVVTSSLTSVGTIGTGVWQGTAIADSFIATPYVKADGTRPLTGAWTTGNFQILHGDGSAGAPSIAFASQPGLGFYRVALDTVALVGADTTTLQVYNAGSNDDSVLELTNAGTSTGDQYLLMREGGITASQWAFGRDDSDSGKIKISQASAPGTNDFFTITTAGLVSLGASGGSQTHVANGNLSVTGTIAASNFSGSSSGTNTGNVTISSANGLSIVGQALSMDLATASVTGTVSASSQTFGGGKTFTGTVTVNPSTQNASLIQRYVNAGDGTGATGLRIGNSGSTQGDAQFFYTNAAATGSPTTTWTFTPRNNADSTNTDAVRITLDKVAGNDGGEYQIATSTSGGSLVLGFLLDSSQKATIGASGGTQTHVFNGGYTATKNVGVGGALTSIAVEQVGATNPLSGTNQIGVYVPMAATSAATATVTGMYSSVSTAAASFTAPVVRSFYAGGIVAGSGSTITRAISYLADPQTVGTNNCTGICDNVAFSGNYALHFTSTYASIFGGIITMGATTANASVGLRITSGNSGILTGATQRNIFLDNVLSSSATTGGVGIHSQIITQDASFVMPFGYSYYAPTATKGAASTITRLINYRGENQTAGGTGNAFMSDNDSFTGNWQVNFTSTNPSTIAGPLGIPDGASNAPAIYFNSQSTMGLQKYATDSLRLVGSDTTTFQVWNAGSNDNSVVELTNNGSSTGDQYLLMREGGDSATQWSFGRDDSDSGSIVISQSSSPGTNNVFKSTTAGAIFFPLHTTTGNAANAVLDSGTGALQRSTSSIRYKKNVVDLKIDSSKIYDLRPVSYDEKATDIHRFGLIAEEVERVLPDLVDYIPENIAIKGSSSKKLIPDAVKYSMISVLLLKEVQKLRKEVNELKTVKSGDVVIVPFKKKSVGK